MAEAVLVVEVYLVRKNLFVLWIVAVKFKDPAGPFYFPQLFNYHNMPKG